jgi:hypothetical protein
MKKTTIFKFFAACAVLSSEASYAQMSLLSNFSANYGNGTSAGEIAGFDKVSKKLFVTSSSSAAYQINIFDLSNPSSSVGVGAIDFSSSFGITANMSALSSVAINSAKGFGVASLIPTANTTTLGKVGFFDLASRTSLGTIDVGYHPDSVSFSPDGSKLIVVNEGEFNASSATNAPGSISVIDVSSITNGNLANLVSLTPVTRDFSSGNLASGVSLSGIRNSNVAAIGTSGTFISSVPDFTQAANQNPNAIEPEYASVIGDKVYVSLQDNNAIGEYDLTQNLWTKITNLGTITQTIDATDTGSTISITQTVKGMPMPDTVATYSKNGKTYVVTANEGDARVDDRDISRFGDIAGSDSMNTILDSNYPTSNTDVRADAQLGRLNVSRIDGDTNGNGKIDEIRMLGTRSFTIWEVTGAGLQLTYDSGSYFETYIRDNDASGWVDGRSDDKGPEPEGLTLGEIDGKTFAFIGMERNNGIFMFDITDPNAPSFFGYTRTSDGSNTPLRPEGMSFISAADSPNGQNLLIVGYEGDGTTASERIGVYSVVPEPQTYILLGIGAAFLLWRVHRRAC